MNIFSVFFFLVILGFNLLHATDFSDVDAVIKKYENKLSSSDTWIPFNELDNIVSQFNSLVTSFKLSDESNDNLRRTIIYNVPYYAGVTLTVIPKECIEEEILKILDILDLSRFNSVKRLDLLETLIKSGSVASVKQLTNKLLDSYPNDLFNHASIMKESSPNRYDRPLFWLAAIVKRWDITRVSEQNYQQIEEFLCNLLCPTGIATVWEKSINRQQYIDTINEWKTTHNRT